MCPKLPTIQFSESNKIEMNHAFNNFLHCKSFFHCRSRLGWSGLPTHVFGAPAPAMAQETIAAASHLTFSTPPSRSAVPTRFENNTAVLQMLNESQVSLEPSEFGQMIDNLMADHPSLQILLDASLEDSDLTRLTPVNLNLESVRMEVPLSIFCFSRTTVLTPSETAS